MSGAAARIQEVAWVRERGATAGATHRSTKRNEERETSKKKGAVSVPVSSLAFYRRYTELLLRRYMQVSMRMGKVPSVLGSCMFRGRVSSRPVQSFEDAVIFVYDIERCMKQLTPEERELIARIALQEYTQAEAAELTGQSLRTLVRRYGEAMDVLTKIFLEKDLLEVESLFAGQ